MFGRSSTPSRDSATAPNRTTASVAIATVTGRFRDPSAMRISERHGLDARALLESALADRDHLLPRGQPGEDLRGVARDRARPDRHAVDRVARGDEHERVAVL